MLSLYTLVFVILLLTHSATCYAGYSQGLSRGKLRGRLEEKKEHVDFLKKLDDHLASEWDSVVEETEVVPQKNYKELN
jgi:hypothetical protein